MRKYWYYTWRSASSFGSGVSLSDDGEFDILRAMKFVKNKYSVNVVIDNWSEISSTQYEKLNKYYNTNNKE